MRLIVPDTVLKFRDPGLKSSREIRPKAVGGGIFGRFSLAIADVVMPGVATGHVGSDVRIRFGYSRSNRC